MQWFGGGPHIPRRVVPLPSNADHLIVDVYVRYLRVKVVSAEDLDMEAPEITMAVPRANKIAHLKLR